MKNPTGKGNEPVFILPLSGKKRKKNNIYVIYLISV